MRLNIDINNILGVDRYYEEGMRIRIDLDRNNLKILLGDIISLLTIEEVESITDYTYNGDD